MMKKSYLLILMVCFFSFPPLTWGHNVKSENDIGAVLHIDPGDQPKTGEQSTMILEFKDKKSTFTLEACDCKLSIYSENSKIFEADLKSVSKSDKLVAGVNFTFPKAGSYQIKVTGTPKKEDTFEEFELPYETFVSEKPHTTAPPETSGFKISSWVSGHVIHLAGAFLVLGFLILALIKQSWNIKHD